MSTFVEVEFPVIVNLAPSQLHQGMYHEMEEAVKRKYSGVAHAKIGYIKRDSVRIVSKQIGKYEGSHLTGHMSFHLTIRCLATMPLKDMEIEAIVTMKNDAGLVCKNFSFPYSLFVPNIPGDPENTQLSTVNTNDSVRVRVIDSRLKAPALDLKGERARPEYWVICRLSAVNLDAVHRLDLPQSADSPGIIIDTIEDMDAIKDEQMQLSGGMFQNLQNIKDVIDGIRHDYVEYLLKLPDLSRDPIIRSQIKPGENFVVGQMIQMNGHQARIRVLKSSISQSGEMTFNLPGSMEVAKDILVILTGSVRSWKMRELDMWLLHVKYIINPYEMIHITKTYKSQLSVLSVVDVHQIPYEERVISRAYYKMAEMLHEYGVPLLPQGVKVNIACLAESPGGFVQALVDHRLTERNRKYSTTINAISLSPNTQRETWQDFRETHTKFYEDTVGSDFSEKIKIRVVLQEGDLTLKDDREAFKAKYKHKNELAHLVTADGGFDRDKTSSDLEELDTARLILAEVSMALEIQAQGGAFVLKIFDMATRFTVDLLSILAYVYENVSIVKPKSSRSANSEKYVVCTGFKFAQENEDLIRITEDLITNGVYRKMEAGEYFHHLTLTQDEEIKKTIVTYNSIFMKKQTEVIVSGRDYASRYIATGCLGGRDDHEYCMRSYVQEQLRRAIKFSDEVLPK